MNSEYARGLFLDPRSWKVDFQSSELWNPEKYGVSIDLHQDAFNIPKVGIGTNYKFVVTTEVWEKPIRNTLSYLRSKGLKIFLVAREPIKYGDLINAMFAYEKFNINGEYFFNPDVVLAAGKRYADLWADKTKTYITGYPRWDRYLMKFRDKSALSNDHKYLNKNKKWIFFPSYPPVHYKKINGVDVNIDLTNEMEETLTALLDFSNKNKEFQIVVKIHPMSMKCYLKGTGSGNEVSGTLKRFYLQPSDNMIVIGDDRFNNEISKELVYNSDIVVGFMSTMMLEAALLNKPIVNVLLGKSQSINGIEEFPKFLKTAYCYNDLLDILGSVSSIGSLPDYVVKDYLGVVDGNCCKNICNIILQECNFK